MSLIFSLTDGNSSYDLTSMVIENNIQFASGDMVTKWHTTSAGGNQLLEWHDGDRAVTFQMTVKGTDNELLNTLTTLQRWARQAANAELNPERYRPVFLKVQYPNASNATLQPIRRMDVDASNALLHTYKRTAGHLYHIGVYMALGPYGQAEKPLYLYNALSNGAFARFSGTVPLNWAKIDGAETFTADEAVALVGRYGLKMAGIASGDGLISDATVVPAYQQMRGSVWLKIVSGTVDVRLVNVSGGGTMAEKTGLTAANIASQAAYTTNDRNGNAWYLIFLPAVTLTATTSVQFVVTATALATLYVDMAQIRTLDAVTRPPLPNMDFPGDIIGGKAGLVGGFDSDGTVTIETDVYFGGEGSQLAILADSELYYSQLFEIETLNEEWVVRVALYHDDDDTDNEDDFTLSLLDGAGNVLDSITDDPTSYAEALTTATGGDTKTWAIYELSGTNSAYPGFRIQLAVDGSSGSVSLYVDHVYTWQTEQVAGLVADYAAISDSKIYNRNDAASGTENRYNYVHVFNLPGDAPAALALDVTCYAYGGWASAAKQMWLHRYDEDRYSALVPSFECESTTTWFVGAGTWTPTVDATAHGGNHRRLTGATGSEKYLYMILGLDDARRWSAITRHVYVRARTSHKTSAQLQFGLAQHGTAIVLRNEEVVTFSADNTWEWHDLGPINLNYSDIADNYTAANGSVFRIYATVNTGQTIDLDVAYYLPVAPGHFARWAFPAFFDAQVVRIDGLRKLTVRANEGLAIPHVGSGVWELPAGPVSSVLYFGWAADDNEHVMADYATIRARITPRTRYLLGTT